MMSKEYFQAAAVADEEEIVQLNDYLSRRALTKCFAKNSRGDDYGLRLPEEKSQPARSIAPYHYLRTDLALLLGPSGSKLLNRTWAKFHLSPLEQNPDRLRPALMNLFSVSARIAAPKGVGRALKRLVGEFEQRYFPVVVDQISSDQQRDSRRFALLSVLQNGMVDSMLNGLLESSTETEPERKGPRSSELSIPIEKDPNIARRQFLFEAAYRSKSWSEAYTQGRLLKPTTANTPAQNARFGHVCEALLSRPAPPSKKKQILTDLADCLEVPLSRRIQCALEALSIPFSSCQPGRLEETVCQLLPPGDPWWRASLSRLYRHRPVPGRWTDDLRSLCQTEPTSRPFGRVILNLLKLSRQRAKSGLSRYGLAGPCFRSEAADIRQRLDRVRESVSTWLAILPPGEEPIPTASSAPLTLTRERWQTLAELCRDLRVEPPHQARVQHQAHPIRVVQAQGARCLVLSPDFVALSEGEQRFLLARALFREASGLDRLAHRAASLNNPSLLYERALAYADWMGHPMSILQEHQAQSGDRVVVNVVLEEMFWLTEDENYARLAQILNHGGWCPIFEREADLFAATQSDLITVSHALVKAELWGKLSCQASDREGLGVLLDRQHPELFLRLQSLWMGVAERLQSEQLPTR